MEFKEKNGNVSTSTKKKTKKTMGMIDETVKEQISSEEEKYEDKRKRPT